MSLLVDAADPSFVAHDLVLVIEGSRSVYRCRTCSARAVEQHRLRLVRGSCPGPQAGRTSTQTPRAAAVKRRSGGLVGVVASRRLPRKQFLAVRPSSNSVVGRTYVSPGKP